MNRIIELSNGLRIANFSSPHPFTFVDGSILPEVSAEEAERLKIDFIEQPYEHMTANGVNYNDIELSFELSDEVLNEVGRWKEKFRNRLVDIVLCPLPMITALKNDEVLLVTPFRAVRMGDRIKKLAEIDKFCI
tara:strand:- start:2183 stop:2584 length:402 start_codon:yes stop_codon:yes gene_type:complete